MSGAFHRRRPSADSRGVSTQVGFVLLVSLVLVGATVAALAGWTVIDSLESESEAESALAAAAGADDAITTAARTGQTQSVSVDGDAVRDEGTVSVVWWNESGVDDRTSVENRTLGAIVYELDDRTVVYQGGGIWVERDGTYRTHAEPPLGVDDDVLDVRLLVIEGDDKRTYRTVGPHPDASRSTDLSNGSAGETAPERGYDNLSVVVESDHHDGWEAAFETAFAPDGTTNVTLNAHETDPTAGTGGEDTVELVVERVSETYAHHRVTVRTVYLSS